MINELLRWILVISVIDVMKLLLVVGRFTPGVIKFTRVLDTFVSETEADGKTDDFVPFFFLCGSYAIQ